MIDLPEGKIGVVVSGGFDSSVLWHVVYGKCLEEGRECIPYTVPKNDGALTYATRMLEWSCNYYNTKRLHPFVVNADNVDWEREIYQGHEVEAQLRGGVKELISKGYADVVYIGVNEYPPNHETLCDYHTPGPRNLSRDSDVEWNGRHVKDIILQPFADLKKDDIVQLAFGLGILEPIAEITHSCVELIRGRCGECFWCKEREWGFAEAGQLDNGTN
jgi:hypothetical protein